MTIPWAKLCQDPSSWIKPECAPDEFQWADPSKIRIGDVFRLIDHWRQRQAHGLKPLIWLSSCPLLEDAEQQSEHSRSSSSSRRNTDPRSEEGARSTANDRDDSMSKDRAGEDSDHSGASNIHFEHPDTYMIHDIGPAEDVRTYSPMTSNHFDTQFGNAQGDLSVHYY